MVFLGHLEAAILVGVVGVVPSIFTRTPLILHLLVVLEVQALLLLGSAQQT
jgi:hypothetical protein